MRARRSPHSLTHTDGRGGARMVDVSGKPTTRRTAAAAGRLIVSAAAMRAVRGGRLPKGGVTEAARLAGILAAKRTAEAIPLCHPIALEHVRVEVHAEAKGFRIEAEVVTVGRTGAEMEALHAVALAGLTLYDMMKALDRGMVLTEVRLLQKTGGTRGDYPGP